MRYNFDWDPIKAKQNVHKHKVSFQRAATVFRDPGAISIFDEEHSQDEERWVTIGLDNEGILLVISHTFKTINNVSCNIRIISCRKATRKEVKQYEG